MLGAKWYLKQFDLPKLPADAIAQLHFGGTFYKTRVWVNGVEVGGHEGGYHEYSFDIAPQLRDKNTLAVLVDNRPGKFTIPGFGARGAPDAWYDWWAYGGITRDVWLELQGPVRIANQFIRTRLEETPGERPLNPPTRVAIVTNRVRLQARDTSGLKLRVTVEDASGRVRGSQEQPVQARRRARDGGDVEGRLVPVESGVPHRASHARQRGRRPGPRAGRGRTRPSACARSRSAIVTCW